MQKYFGILVLPVLLAFCGSVVAETSIAILDFELLDLSLAPGIPAEIQRTASIKVLLENELRGAGYHIAAIDSNQQQAANSGAGYLFDHSDLAAALAKDSGADYVFVGKLHKPSFLFAYLLGHLVDVKQSKLKGNYVVETKGGDKKLTLKAVESLAAKIDGHLEHRYSFPAPEGVK